MAQAIRIEDALDYIFIANDSGSDTYLISSDVAPNASGMTSAISAAVAAATAAAATTMSAVGVGGGGGANGEADFNLSSDAADADMGAATAATAAAAAGSIVESSLASVNETSTLWESSTVADVNGVTSISAAALVAENLYNSVAVDLGSMLINDSYLMDLNETAMLGGSGNGLYGDLLFNGTDLMATGNGTGNITTTDDDLAELLKMAATSVVLGLMILVTIIGNVFVIAAIILERNLQNVANYLVASLAVADLFVACLVMPLGAVYEISQGWILGPELCDIWTSCDVLCCTASILHLLAIAADRYWAVTNIDYIHSRTSKRVLTMIFCVWTAAVVVSLAPQFGWKDPDYLQRIEQQKCMVSQDVAYQVFATCCTFYVPLMVILVLYWKIYQTARKRIHRRRPRPTDATANNNQPDLSAQKKRKRLRLRLGKFTPQGKSNTLTAGTGTSLGLVEGNSTNTVNTVEDTEFSSSNVDTKSRAGIEVTTNFSNPTEVQSTSSNQITTVSHLVALANQERCVTTKPNHQQQQQQQQQQQHQHEQQQQQEQEQLRTQHDTEHDAQGNNLTSTTSRTPIMSKSGTSSATSATISTTATTALTSTSSTLKTIIHNSSCSSSSSNQNRVSITLPIAEVNVGTSPEAAEAARAATEAAATVVSLEVEKAAEISTNATLTANDGNANNPATNATITTNDVEVLEDPLLQQQLQQVQQHQQEQQEQQQQKPQQQQHEQTGVRRSNTIGGGVSSVGVGGASTSNATTITSISALSPQTPITLPSGGTGSVVGPLTHPLAPGSTNPSNQVTPTPKPKHQQHQQQQQLSSISNPMHKVTKRKETLEAKRERKAAKTLAIITGAFVVCWLPFFVTALLLPLCEECEISDSIASFFLWLGYFNSTLNPVIYTIFSPEFRQAFKRILFGAHRPVHYRSGKL